jgi:Spo7-like protein
MDHSSLNGKVAQEDVLNIEAEERGQETKRNYDPDIQSTIDNSPRPDTFSTVKPIPTTILSGQFTVTTDSWSTTPAITLSETPYDDQERPAVNIGSEPDSERNLQLKNSSESTIQPSTSNDSTSPTPRAGTPSDGSKPRRRKKTNLSTSSSSEGDHHHSRSNSSASTTAEQSISFKHPLQTFRNLLIMEQSLRQQYVAMAVSRRKHVLFFSFLILSSLYFGYAMFINPSIYRLVNFFDQLMFMASIVILGLFYLTGLYTKAFVYSPRFIHNANKGLRPFNVKLVRVPRTWKEYTISLLWDPRYASAQGRLVKLILSARAFNPEIVEGWEIYRNEYWERENIRKRRLKGSVSISSNGPSGGQPGTTAPSGPRDRRPRRRTVTKSKNV